MIENNQATDESQIRFLLGEFENAIREKDRDRIMSLYSPEIVAFDVVPPLDYAGTTAYAESFQRMFAAFRGPIVFETRHLSITVGADVGFSHSLVRTSGTMEGGQETDRWLRRTVGLRKIGGQWQITHEHVSLPVNPESGNAVQDLQPT